MLCRSYHTSCVGFVGGYVQLFPVTILVILYMDWGVLSFERVDQKVVVDCDSKVNYIGSREQLRGKL